VETDGGDPLGGEHLGETGISEKKSRVSERKMRERLCTNAAEAG